MPRHLLVLALCAALLSSAPVRAQPQAPTEVADAPARVIVKYRPDSTLLRNDGATVADEHARRARELGARVGLELRAGAGLAERMQVLLTHGMTSDALAQRLAAENDIEYAVPDERRRHFTAPNDPLYLAGPPLEGDIGGPVVGQWYLRAPAGDVQSSINVEPAWSVAAGGVPIVVAVIDTGVRYDHRDLKRVVDGGTLLPGYDMISDVATANDGNGRDADAADPGDWLTLAEVTQRTSPYYGCGTVGEDSSWHGTQTSSLIGALTDNGAGMASIGRTLRILPVRVLGKCGGFDSDIIAGMRWAAGLSVPGIPANRNPARVLNLSLGGGGSCSNAYKDAVSAINAVGAVVVAAAGNSTGHAVGVPGNCPGVIAVAALRHVGTKVGFSDLGPDISISAPGGNCINIDPGSPCLYPIITATNAGTTGPTPDAAGGSIYSDSFDASVGTSFSAPLVAGTAALMLSVKPSLTATQVRDRLRVTARPFPTTGGDNGDGTPVLQCRPPNAMGKAQFDQLQCYCTTSTCGAGMLDAGAAVFAATAAQLSIARAGAGRVTSSPSGVDCGSDCSELYPTATTVTLDAIPMAAAAGGKHVFTGWGGDCAAADTASLCVLTLDADKTATADFQYIGDGSDYSREYVQKAYIAYYGRPADPAGQGYWALRMDAEGQSIDSIINAFGKSDEFNRRYGGLGYTQLVTKIYQQTLNRNPDSDGLAYYVAELQAGRKTLQTITLDVLNGAVSAPDATVVFDKLNVAKYYTAKVADGCPYGTEQDGVNALVAVTSSIATVNTAKAAIDSRCGG